MKKYKILDVFSYEPKSIIDLKQLEEIFMDGIDDSNFILRGYQVKKYNQRLNLEKNIEMAVNELRNEGKSIALIKNREKIIAVIGYKEL